MNARTFQSLLLTQLGNLLEPGLCLGCGHNLKNPGSFCIRCILRLEAVKNPCKLCGDENPGPDTTCAACLYDPPRWQQLVAPLQYQGMSREMLVRFKFSESLALANSLIETVISRFATQQPRPEAIIPIPLHHQRYMQRGYNQAFEIAKLISRKLNIPVDNNCLRRIRPTQAQAGLSAYKRQKNILKAFEAINQKAYRHIAVVDDIVTTGSTVNEATKILHRAGIKTVDVWALARVVRG